MCKTDKKTKNYITSLTRGQMLNRNREQGKCLSHLSSQYLKNFIIGYIPLPYFLFPLCIFCFSDLMFFMLYQEP